MSLLGVFRFISLLFCLILTSPALAADIQVDQSLRTELDRLQQVHGIGEWNNFGKERAALLRSLTLSARHDDGTLYDPEPSAKLKIIRMSGRTEIGDTDKLRSVLNDPTHGYRSVIVMDGPGGNFGEALRLGRLIHESIYMRQDDGLSAVFVRVGTSCLSACAVAAAWAGRALYVEQGAELGFHLPMFQGDEANRVAPIGKVLDKAYDIAAAYNELLIEDMAHRDLFREAYKHRDEKSFHYIRTGYDAVRYGFSAAATGSMGKPVHIEGVGAAVLARLCSQKYDLDPSRKTFLDNEYAVPYLNWRGKTLGDIVEANDVQWFAASSDFEFTDLHCRFGMDESRYLHLWMTRDPMSCTTSICAARAPERPSLVTNIEMQRALSCADNRYSGQGSRTVERDVRMRNKPILGAKIVTRLKADDTVRVHGCRGTDDNQSVWYDVSFGSFRGWASGRYFR